MSIELAECSLIEELADLFASRPTSEQILDYRPSASVVARAGELLERQREGSLAPDEVSELEQFSQAEMLMRLIKARIRTDRHEHAHSA